MGEEVMGIEAGEVIGDCCGEVLMSCVAGIVSLGD